MDLQVGGIHFENNQIIEGKLDSEGKAHYDNVPEKAIKVEYEQYKKGRSISGFSFTFKQKKMSNLPIKNKSDPDTIDIFSKMTDAQRHLFSHKLSELPEMGKYSHGTESYPQFAVRIAEMLQNPEKFKELYPYLQKVGFKAA